MISTDKEYFAMIEPTGASTAPIIDDITRKATALLRICAEGDRYRGFHSCSGTGCCAASDNTDHFLPDRRITHSLIVHYVARHRNEVPRADLEYIASLAEIAEPTAKEIA